MARGRAWRRLLRALAPLLFVGLSATACDDGLSGPSRTVHDVRACGETNVTLAEATRHFALSLPPDAARVRFYADGGGRGEVNLSLRFQTTPVQFDRFVSGSRLPAPQPYAETAPPWRAGPTPPHWTEGSGPACHLDAGFHFSEVADQWEGDKGYVRDVAVDRSDPTHPQVLVAAGDL